MKDDYIRIRVTPEFKKVIRQKAKESEMDLTEYVISALQENPVIVLDEGKSLAAAFYELKNALAGLNLITNPDMVKVLEMEEGLCRLLRCLMQKIAH